MRSAPSKGSSSRPSAAVVRSIRTHNTIVALHTEGSDVVALNLCIRRPGSTATDNDTIAKNMARGAGEPAAKTLERIQRLFAPPGRGGGGSAAGRGAKDDPLAACPAVSVLGTDPSGDEAVLEELDASMPNAEYWRRARQLVLGDQRVAVWYNIPTVTDVVPPAKPFVGLPSVCASVTAVFAKPEDLHYEWRVKTGEGSAPGQEADVLGTGPAFEPGADLLGKQLVLSVTPNPVTGPWTQIELEPVQRPPSPVQRWGETPTTVAFPAFRVVSYNILYDDFCTSKRCKATIYPFATDDVLSIENRRVRILQELLAYNADIVCLQECGKELFARYLLPAMRVRGFDGLYVNKNGGVQEGCGFLFRKARFSLESSEVIPLNWSTLVKQEAKLAAGIALHAEMKEALSNVTSVGAVLTLKETSTGQELVLGNTHLFYHANACHIRVVQAYLMLSCLRSASVKAVEADGGEGRPIVLCGDCNFTHTTGGYRLVTTGQVEDTHHSWEKGKLFWWGCDRQLGYSEDQLAEMLDVGSLPNAGAAKAAKAKGKEGEAEQPQPEPEKPREPLTDFFHETLHSAVKLVDAYGRTDPSLPWTNYTLTFREVIDYIFFSEESIDVLRTVPIPPESELSENYALPNAKYPSDHVALIADLTFKR